MSGYCSCDNVYDRTGLTTSDIGTAELTVLINRASIELNNTLNVKIFRESVTALGGYKENPQDRSNVTFYTRAYPLADSNDDFSVGTADIEVYSWDGETKTEYAVASIADDEDGKFTLTSAPTAEESLYLTYEYLPIKISDEMIQQACTELSGYYAVKRIHGRGIGIKKFRLGTLSIEKGDTVGKDFFDEYHRTLNLIRRKKFYITTGQDLLEVPEDG